MQEGNQALRARRHETMHPVQMSPPTSAHGAMKSTILPAVEYASFHSDMSSFLSSTGRSVGVPDFTSNVSDMNMDHVEGRKSASSACEPYQAGFEAAISQLQQMMYRSRGTDFGYSAAPPWPSAETALFVLAVENTGNAVSGLPRPSTLSLDRPLMTPPKTPVFVGGSESWAVTPTCKPPAD